MRPECTRSRRWAHCGRRRPPDGGNSGQGAAAPARSRVPWTGSRFAGTPDPPPPYTVAPAFPQLKFEFPVVLVPAQGTSRLFVGELKGRIYSFPNDPDCAKADLALDLAKLHSDLSALYGLVFHPQFEKTAMFTFATSGRTTCPTARSSRGSR